MSFSQRLTIILSVFSLLLWGESLYAASSPNTLPNVLLLTIDTLRPDHLGCYGYQQIETPNIDHLAQEGVLMLQAYTPVPLTLPSHVSIMTGQYPIRHGVQDNGIFILNDSADTLAEILKNHGYTTGAIVSSYILASHFGLSQGFDSYDDHFNQNKRIESYRPGKSVTDLAKKWLQKNGKSPFFLWLHYFDPHAPYEPPPPFKQKYQGRPYDGEIAYLDQCLGQLLDKLKKLKLMDNTCIILLADHGEGLWEHQEQTHGLFIYETTLRIPLIFRYPARFPRKARINSLVRTIDLMPTILEILHLPAEDIKMQGISLLPLLTGTKKKINLNLYCASLYPQLNFNWAPLEGIITPDHWKYILAPKPELYNLRKDDKEQKNLYSTRPKKAAALKKSLLRLKHDLTANSKTAARQIALSTETRARLQSLGYIFNSEQNSASTLPDPKDKAPVLAQIDRARELETKGYLDQAIQEYKSILEKDANNKMVHYSLGLAYRKAGKLLKAVAEIKKVVQQDPRYFDTHNILGLLYEQLDKPQKAIDEYQQAIKVDHYFANAHNNLGMAYCKIKNFTLAIKEFKQTLSLSSNSILSSITHQNLGGVYLRQKRLAEGIRELSQSVALNPFNREARLSLANAYYRNEQTERSIDEWKNIVGIWPDDHIAYFKLARLLLVVGKPKKAIQNLQKCIQLRPDFWEARRLLKQLYQP